MTRKAQQHTGEEDQALILQPIRFDVGQVSWRQTQGRWVELRELKRAAPIQEHTHKNPYWSINNANR